MWLIRGTGTEGLSGIPLVRPVTKRLSVIRPLLFVTRSEVLSYVKSQKLRPCTDESNDSDEYTRNRIRHELVPLFQKYNPGFVEHISHLSQIVARENDFLAARTARAIGAAVRSGKNAISLDLKLFFRYNKVIQTRLLKAVLPERRSWGNVERLLQWILRSPDTQWELSRSWRIEKRKDTVVFRKTMSVHET